jgi:hypothetical protein
VEHRSSNDVLDDSTFLALQEGNPSNESRCSTRSKFRRRQKRFREQDAGAVRRGISGITRSFETEKRNAAE